MANIALCVGTLGIWLCENAILEFRNECFIHRNVKYEFYYDTVSRNWWRDDSLSALNRDAQQTSIENVYSDIQRHFYNIDDQSCIKLKIEYHY